MTAPHPDGLARTSGTTAGLRDADDLESAYLVHGAVVTRAVRRLVADPAAVQDVVQEAFLLAWRRRAAYDPARGPLRPWLLLQARSAAIDHLRARQARPWHRSLVAPAEMPSEEIDDHDATERVLASWVVEEEVRRLPEKHRRVIIETHLRDRPYAEVAAELGIAVGTVRSRVFHALRMMRRSLEQQGLEL